MEFNLNALFAWGLPLIGVVFTVWATYWVVARSLMQKPGNRLYRQLAQLAIVILGMIALVLFLPFDNETRGQLLGLFGLVLTAVIALSSTTFVSNAMAGVTLKTIGSFHTGDFIQVADYFGRVKTKTLLHTEIQSEDRDTITLPNMFIMTNPVKVVDQSGTLISTDVTIGYDVHREGVRVALLAAADDAGLNDGFMQITALDNFAVSYRVTGFLSDVNHIVSKRTELRAKVLDRLHEAAIEIMTPNVMAQRPINTAQIPAPTQAQDQPGYLTGRAEQMMFDKADKAARINKIRNQTHRLAEEIQALEKTDAEGHALDIAWRKHQLRAQEAFLAQVDEDHDGVS